MKGFLIFIKCLVLFFTPRFVEDRVALYRDDDGSLQVFCLESQLNDSEKVLIECYGTIRTITWLGICKGGRCALD